MRSQLLWILLFNRIVMGALAAMLRRDEPRRMADLRNVSIAASGTKA